MYYPDPNIKERSQVSRIRRALSDWEYDVATGGNEAQPLAAYLSDAGFVSKSKGSQSTDRFWQLFCAGVVVVALGGWAVSTILGGLK